MFPLQVKDDAKPYQVPPRCGVYAPQEPFKRVRKATRTTSAGITGVGEMSDVTALSWYPNLLAQCNYVYTL